MIKKEKVILFQGDINCYNRNYNIKDNVNIGKKIDL